MAADELPSRPRSAGLLRRRWRQGGLIAVLAGAALLAAGCGGNSSPPSVASLGTTTSGSGASSQSGTTPSSAGGPAVGGRAGGPGNGFVAQMKVGSVTAGLAFSNCMRSHGVAGFPEPNSQGLITVGSSEGIDPSSPAFQRALSACHKKLPNGGQPTPQQAAQARAQAIAFSACMRAHGLPDFPDPDITGNRISIRLGGGPGSDLNPASPAFQAAQKACLKLVPGAGPSGK